MSQKYGDSCKQCTRFYLSSIQLDRTESKPYQNFPVAHEKGDSLVSKTSLDNQYEIKVHKPKEIL